MKTLFILPKPLSARYARWRRRRNASDTPYSPCQRPTPNGALPAGELVVYPDPNQCLSTNGGGERNRTADLLLAKQALSQLSYTPAFQADS
jgi:hypothetical protein